MHRFQPIRPTRVSWLLLSVLALGIFAACGGDDADSPAAMPAGSATTDAELVEPTATVAQDGNSTATDAPRQAATAVEPEPTATASEPPPAPEPQLPVTVTNVDGEEITITDVSRMVLLNGDYTEIIFALGLGGNIVGVDSTSTYPEEARDLPGIGFQRALAAEGILALSPTLVIGNELAGPPQVLEQLETAGVTVVIFPDVTTLEGIPNKLQWIADALGVPGEGARLAGETTAKIAAVQELAASVPEQRSALFLYVRGATAQLIGGEDTVADTMIAAAGARNAATEAGIIGFQPMTAELLAITQPDLLILLTAGLESVGGIDGLLEIPGVAQIPAAQSGAIIDFDDLYFLGFGPRTPDALRDLLFALHPELEG